MEKMMTPEVSSQEKDMIVQNIIGKLKRHFGKTLENATKDELYKASAICIRDNIMDQWLAANEQVEKRGLKQVYYMSAEFLMGRAYINNMVNLGLLEQYKAAFQELGLELNEIANQETDAGLGNGGLGRLAACFLESLATLDLPAIGCGIRYEYGLFKQKIIDGAQIEVEDNWLQDGCVWEVERPDEQVEIHYNGEIEEVWTEHGLKIHHKNYNTVIAVPYDVPVVGYKSKCPATLRLWSARAKESFDIRSFNQGNYAKAMMDAEMAEAISKVLYPADDHDQGKQLRLRQFYFFTSATMQSLVRKHKKLYGDLHTLPEHAVVQINDTHPTLAIPELMRILMDEEGFSWDDAYSIVSRMFNYTNHTILTEALERWDEKMFRTLLPRIYSIVQAINQKYCEQLNIYYPGQMDRIAHMAIVAYGQIRMANLCVAVCGHVNGVSQLHGNILRESLFADENRIHPEKFLAFTNGITHRRWLAVANPGLTKLMTEYIGEEFIGDYTQFEKLLPYTKDKDFLKKYAQVKLENKKRLAAYVKEKQGIDININSIFDVQAKRLHEYKRQLLKCIHILYLYNQIIKNPDTLTQPVTFFFAAKAAPGYMRAKKIIRLINAIADLVNNDPRTKDKIQVVFIENYCVSAAEVLIPAADISEQLSTAGLEASGTGNMKFMMNGAITLGTMDGANVEIYEQVGPRNIFIFGANVNEINMMNSYHTYRPGSFYEQNVDIREALNRMIDGTLPGVSTGLFSDLYQSLLFGDGADKYFLLYDFSSYAQAFAKAVEMYQHHNDQWMEMAAINTAKSGFFSSDRTIAEYNDQVWKLKKF
jgi:starch phosphorylase